jgi:hypothetical protein
MDNSMHQEMATREIRGFRRRFRKRAKDLKAILHTAPFPGSAKLSQEMAWIEEANEAADRLLQERAR